MGFFDRLTGREEPRQNQAPSADQQAVDRYRYMLKTAPPEAIEQAHEEAFARLNPEQRRMVLEELMQSTPERERTQTGDDPRQLARLATRAELRQPGLMERLFGGTGSRSGMGYGGGGMGGGMGMGGGIGMGGLMAGSLLTSIAGGFIGSAIANQFFDSPDVQRDFASSEFNSGEGLMGEPLQGNDSTATQDWSNPASNDQFGNDGVGGNEDLDTVGSSFDDGGFDGGDFDGGSDLG